MAAIFQQFRDNWRKIYEELEKLRIRIINANKEPTYGLHRKKQMPFFRMFEREVFEDASGAGRVADLPKDDRISYLVDLTQKIFLAVERELKLVGFWESIPARNKLKADLQRIILGPEFAKLPGLIENRARALSAGSWRSPRAKTISYFTPNSFYGSYLQNHKIG